MLSQLLLFVYQHASYTYVYNLFRDETTNNRITKHFFKSLLLSEIMFYGGAEFSIPRNHNVLIITFSSLFEDTQEYLVPPNEIATTYIVLIPTKTYYTTQHIYVIKYS